MTNPAETYREELAQEIHMVRFEDGPCDYLRLLREEAKRVEGAEWTVKDCGRCHHYERPAHICNLCRKGQITKLKKRIEELEHVLRATRVRLRDTNRTTLAIDVVLDEKGD